MRKVLRAKTTDLSLPDVAEPARREHAAEHHPVPGLLVGRADDPAEARADARADRAVAALERQATVDTEPVGAERAASAHAPAVPGRLHRAAAAASGGNAAGPEGGELDPAASARIATAASGGSALNPALRRGMEGAFGGGADFSGVRLHTGATAQALSRSVGARAFTLGSHVFVGEQTDLTRGAGRHLLAHELSHTLDNAPETARRQVRRLVSAAAMDEHIGMSKLLSRDSTYAQIRDGVSAYHKLVKYVPDPKDRAAVSKESAAMLMFLNGLDGQALTYVNSHAKSKNKTVQRRVKLVRALAGDLKHELAQTRKQATEDIYNEGAAGSLATNARDYEKARHQPSPVGFNHMTDDTGINVSNYWKDKGTALGLTEAETRAIRTYGAKNYEFINPAMADIEGWEVGGADDKEKAEKKDEGRTHAAMALQGLAKLPPHKPDTYRGLACTPAEYKRDWAGSSWKLAALGSSSKLKDRAVHFMHAGQGDNLKTKTIGIFVVVHKGNGRDIEEVAAVTSEREVLLLPGTFRITFRHEVPAVKGMSILGHRDERAADFKKIVLIHVEGKGP